MEGLTMTSWKRYIAALVLNICFMLLVLFLKGFDLKIYYIDAFSVAGSVSILLGLLTWITDAGAFDTVGYGFSALFNGKKYKDLYEYTLRKQEKRSRKKLGFLPNIIVGAVFLLISFLISTV